jgi:hypothetical protein
MLDAGLVSAMDLFKQGACRTVALPLSLKSILRQKEEL